MAEVARSIRVGSTGSSESVALTAPFLGGFIAGEGCFSRSGDRFVFKIQVAAHDRAVLLGLRACLGAGSLHDIAARNERWLPNSSLEVTGRRQNFEKTMPFMEAWLPPVSAKWRQFASWRKELIDDIERRPFRVAGVCAVQDCERPIRGRGLCRRHYYRATGY